MRGAASVMRGAASVMRGAASVMRGAASVMRGAASVMRGASRTVGSCDEKAVCIEMKESHAWQSCIQSGVHAFASWIMEANNRRNYLRDTLVYVAIYNYVAIYVYIHVHTMMSTCQRACILCFVLLQRA
jgi:hypothetical protein